VLRDKSHTHAVHEPNQIVLHGPVTYAGSWYRTLKRTALAISCILLPKTIAIAIELLTQKAPAIGRGFELDAIGNATSSTYKC
jgi:hypothetical protein